MRAIKHLSGVSLLVGWGIGPLALRRPVNDHSLNSSTAPESTKGQAEGDQCSPGRIRQQDRQEAQRQEAQPFMMSPNSPKDQRPPGPAGAKTEGLRWLLPGDSRAEKATGCF